MSVPAEDTPLIAPPLGPRRAQTYLGLLALFSVPHAASQVAVYDLLYRVVCQGRGIADDQCLNDPQVSRDVANLLSAASFVTGIVATVIMAVVASLSDRFGRKLGLVWNLTFATLGVAAFPALATQALSVASHWRMLLPYVLTALSGSISLTLNLSVLYISDCLHDPRARTQYLSILLGVFMLVQAVAPGLGSVLLKSGLAINTYMSLCAFLMACGTLCVVFVLQAHRSSEISRAGVVDHLKQFLSRAAGTVSFRNCEPRAQKVNAWTLLVNFFFSNEFAVGFLDLLIVYAKHKFAWQVSQIGQVMFYLFSIRCAWAILGFPVLYAYLSKFWAPQPDKVDWPDLILMSISSLLTLAGYVVIGFAKTSAQYTAGVATLANDGIAGPIWVNALLKHVEESKKGEFLAALGLFIKPLGAFLPAALMKIFQATVDTNKVFLVVIAMATLVTMSLLLIRIQN